MKMNNMSYDDIVGVLKKEAGLTEGEIKAKIDTKLTQLSGLISKEGAAHIIANEHGIRLLDDYNLRRFKIDKIIVGMRSLEILGKVIRKFEAREFNNGIRAGRVGSFMIADETGNIRVVLWGDQCKLLDEIKEDDLVKIRSAYVKESNRGFKELHMNERSKIEINPEGEKLDNVMLVQNNRQLKKITEIHDGDNAEINGWILEVFEPRFYACCPFCNKKAEVNDGKFICQEHGPIAEKIAAVLNMFVDDGSGVIRAVCFRDKAEQILGLENGKVQELKDHPEKFEEIKNKVKGRHIVMFGRAKRNEMFDRTEFLINEFGESDPKFIAENLLKEVEQQKIN